MSMAVNVQHKERQEIIINVVLAVVTRHTYQNDDRYLCRRAVVQVQQGSNGNPFALYAIYWVPEQDMPYQHTTYQHARAWADQYAIPSVWTMEEWPAFATETLAAAAIYQWCEQNAAQVNAIWTLLEDENDQTNYKVCECMECFDIATQYNGRKHLRHCQVCESVDILDGTTICAMHNRARKYISDTCAMCTHTIVWNKIEKRRNGTYIYGRCNCLSLRWSSTAHDGAISMWQVPIA